MRQSHFFLFLNLSQVKLQEAIDYEDLQYANGPRTVALKLKKSDRYTFEEHIEIFFLLDTRILIFP